MARPLRIEYEGAVYHITARGNERKTIFEHQGDYQKFLAILSELPQKFSVIIYGYVLMKNHYHLLIGTPGGNLSKIMHYLNTTYTVYFNLRHERSGHLFQGRYKAFLLEKDPYLLSVSRYMHLNPVRAGIVERPEEYQWSSYDVYIEGGKKKTWLSCNWILNQFSGPQVVARGRYKEFVEQGSSVNHNPFEESKAGIILGSASFVEEIIGKISLESHREVPQSKELRRKIGYQKVVSAVSRRFNMSEQNIMIKGKRNNIARKACIYLLKRLTDMSNEEIAKQFGIGYTAVSQAMSRLEGEMREDQGLGKRVENIEKDLLSEE